MGRNVRTRWVELVVISAFALTLILPACRDEIPGPDRNRAPNTFISSSPPETSDTDYKVHMFWNGTDEDGVVVRYIFVVTDTVLTLDPEGQPQVEILDWDPEARIADRLRGTYTAKTDSIFTFRGYNEAIGATVNRQAFHIAAIDDGGRIDPTPARLQFNARVKGVPQVNFWTVIEDEERPYNPLGLDTISMFTPFDIKFTATTVNNVITGYRWIYNNLCYPDTNRDGLCDWREPRVPGEVISVELANSGSELLPSGTFYFKVIAKDEAGALSKSDIVTGEGVCKVVVNHDPDTKVLYGTCKPQGQPEYTVDFFDELPDTLPYNSLLTVFYQGWDDPKDELQYTDPPIPIKFQFMFERWADGGLARRRSPWYPLDGAEDTDCNSNIDSTTMRVGPFNYYFMTRAFDEQYKEDGTPDTITFRGNFPPTIDSLRLGMWNLEALTGPAQEKIFQPFKTDTVFFGWFGGDPITQTGTGFQDRYDRGDTLYIDAWTINVSVNPPLLTKVYRFVMQGRGHDDPRDPARTGTGIKGWQYFIDDLDGGQYAYRKEGEWIFDSPTHSDEFIANLFEHVVPVVFTVPWSNDIVKGDTLVRYPPAFFGEQNITLIGNDMRDTDLFFEGIRAISPEFADTNRCVLEKPGDWILNNFRLANYAGRDTLQTRFYFKMVF